MKKKIRSPFFEIGVKNYLYGDAVLELAQAADRAAGECDIDTLFIAPYTEIRRVAENTEHLIVFAPYMDLLRPGRGMADVLPEAIRAAGAQGVVINHCEKPMSVSAVRETIARADELGLLSFVCADSILMGQALAQFHPDIINPEPTELIGSGKVNDLDFVLRSQQAIHSVDAQILVEQAAGITSGKQVYDLVAAGAQGVGVASGICASGRPCEIAAEMIRMVREAKDFYNLGEEK